MTLAFIPEIINKDWFSVYVKLGIVVFGWFAVLIAILWDFYYGVQKAKSIGEVTSSEGYRRTVKKVCYYWAMLTFALIFDALIPITYFLPFPLNITPVITLIACLGLVLTEWKSVRESADDKLRRKTDSAVRDVAMLMISNKDAFEQNFNKFLGGITSDEVKNEILEKLTQESNKPNKDSDNEVMDSN